MTPSEMVIFQLRETFPFATVATPRYKWLAASLSLSLSATTSSRKRADAVSAAKKAALLFSGEPRKLRK